MYGIISYGVRDKTKRKVPVKSAAQIAAEIYYQSQVAQQLSEFDVLLDILNAKTGIQTPLKRRFPRILKPVIDHRGFERKFFPEGYGRQRARELKAELMGKLGIEAGGRGGKENVAGGESVYENEVPPNQPEDEEDEDGDENEVDFKVAVQNEIRMKIENLKFDEDDGVIDLTNDDDDFTEIRRQDVQLVELDDDPVFLAVVEYVDGLMRQSSLTKHKPKVKLEEVKAEPTSPVQGMEWEDEQSNVNPVEFAEVVMQEPPNPEPHYPQGRTGLEGPAPKVMRTLCVAEKETQTEPGGCSLCTMTSVDDHKKRRDRLGVFLIQAQSDLHTIVDEAIDVGFPELMEQLSLVQDEEGMKSIVDARLEEARQKLEAEFTKIAEKMGKIG